MAAESLMSLSKTRPKVGLVLSGGGARGTAHIGILKVMEELRVPVDCIAGTSMGSIVGGLYATGMTAQDLEMIVKEIDWGDAFVDAPKRSRLPYRRKEVDRNFLVKASPGFRDGEFVFPQGIIQGQKFNMIMKKLTFPVMDINEFDKLPIPFRAVATDIETGEMVILRSGDLANAMRASMSVPGVFAPVLIDGRMLVDGGVSNNLPVDVARSMGADILIVVDISTPLKWKNEIRSALDITDQLTRILTQRNVQEQIKKLGRDDIFLVPDLREVSSADFNSAMEAIAIGEGAARASIGTLRKLSLSEDAYEAYRAQRRGYQAAPITVDFVRIVNNSNLSDEAIARRLNAKIGEELDLEKLNENIENIYGLDIFERVDYEVMREDDRSGLVVKSEKKSWGPNYVRFGLRLEDNQEGQSSYDLGVSYTKTEVNELGAEWRTIIQIGDNPRLFSDFYQPLDYLSRYYILPSIELESRNQNLYESGNLIAKYRVKSYRVGFEGGRELGTWGRMGLGIERTTGEADVRVGDPTLAEPDFDTGGVYARFLYDTLDNLYFPKEGGIVSARFSWYLSELGSDESFEEFFVRWLGTRSYENNTLGFGIDAGTTFENDNIPLPNLYPLGGFFRLSGYGTDELYGQHIGMARIIYWRQIARIIGQSTYVGGSLEWGNVWNDTDDITLDSLIWSGSVFFGFDSYIGPVYLAGGLAEGGRAAFYLYVGSPF